MTHTVQHRERERQESRTLAKMRVRVCLRVVPESDYRFAILITPMSKCIAQLPTAWHGAVLDVLLRWCAKRRCSGFVAEVFWLDVLYN